MSVPTCWTTNGARNDVTGWVTAPAPVESGSCCCSPADLITVAELSSVWELPHLDWRIVNSLHGPGYHRPRVEWELPILVRSTYLSSGSQLFPDEDITYPMGPWLCGSGPFDGIPHSSFPMDRRTSATPHVSRAARDRVQREHPLMLCPATMTSVDGTMPGGARWESFQIAATCTLIVFTSRYTWVDDPAPAAAVVVGHTEACPPPYAGPSGRPAVRGRVWPAPDQRARGPRQPDQSDAKPGNGGMIRVSVAAGPVRGRAGGLDELRNARPHGPRGYRGAGQVRATRPA